ncbi:MAG: glycosyltransferase [Actinomycetales bacterium]|nr:glycosyltransferase [Actinomycetales bacterium]
MTWLSVATVVRDDPDGIARTLASLQEQDLDGVQWVVVDSSADRAQIPEGVDGLKDSLTLDYVHEEPRGIYAAMNTALSASAGDYVYYLNAGDTLFDARVLHRVRTALADSPGWAFGPVAIEERNGSTVITPPWDYGAERAVAFSRGHFPPHQGTFVATRLLRAIGGFDTTYRVAADYAAFLRLSLEADPTVLPFVVATFREGGTSTEQWQESFRDFHRARREILQPQGAAALRERWETARHYALVYAHRELRPRLSWRQRPTT